MSNIHEHQQNNNCLPYGQVNMIYSTRALWRDLANWTRSYLISIFLGVGYQEAVFLRLYRIPNEFGEFFRFLFGQEIAERHINLLSQHIMILQSVIHSVLAGDQAAVNHNTARLYQNADERAAFLAEINPFWDEIQWKSLFYQYNNLTFQELTTFITQNYDLNINIFDTLLDHALKMGDYYAEGLFKYISQQTKQSIK